MFGRTSNYKSMIEDLRKDYLYFLHIVRRLLSNDGCNCGGSR